MREVLGLGWIVLFCALYLAPALKDGPYLGPADLGSTLSTLTRGAVPLQTNCLAPDGALGAPCAHNSVNGDIIDQAIPWNATDWQLVHAGEVPLWNDLSGTGLPQFLNFESAAASLPTVVGYLFPFSASFLVSIIMKLLLAGIGTYWCCRLLGAGALAAAFGGTTYMLSGPFSGWLGWSISGPLALAGFVVAAAIWCYRRPGRAGPMAALAASVGAAVYGGFPEDYALLAATLFALFAATGIATVARRGHVARVGACSIAAGTLLGVGLSAPLWLPGVSVLRHSVRGGQIDATGLPLHYAALLFTQGYDGLPIAGNVFFGSPKDPGLYFETAAYLGPVALALCLVALVALRHRPVVVGLATMGLVAFLLSYRLGPVSPVQRLVIDVGLGNLVLSRALVLLGFAIAVLGALGAQWLVERGTEGVPAAGRFAGGACLLLGASAVIGIVVAGLWAAALRGTLPATFLALRRDSLYAPTASVVLLLAVGLVAAGVGPRRVFGRVTGSPSAGPSRLASKPEIAAVLLGALLVGQSLYLLASGVGINSYSRTDAPTTSALTALEGHLGSSLLGIDNGGTFTASTATGMTDTVVVGGTTLFSFPGVASASFADVCVGDEVTVTGSTSSSTVTAARVDALAHGSMPAGIKAASPALVGTVVTVEGSSVAHSCGTASPDVRQWQGIGLYPEMNLLYGIDELGLHDPTVPRSYFTSWPVPDAGQTTGTVNLFVPSVDTVALARRYGVGYVLAYPGLPAPAGMTKVATIAGSDLYRVPDSVRFSIDATADEVVSARHPDDATYELVVSAPKSATLVARITASPGWQASSAGERLSLGVADGSFLSVALPAGTAVVTLSYRPPHLFLALLVVLASLLALVGLALGNAYLRRRSRTDSASLQRAGR